MNLLRLLKFTCTYRCPWTLDFIFIICTN